MVLYYQKVYALDVKQMHISTKSWKNVYAHLGIP